MNRVTPFVRDGKFDVVIAAGPRVEVWPSVGARTLSMTATEFGLSVGMFGGVGLKVKGAIPKSGSSGALILIEDVQKRIHRIEARALIRMSAQNEFPSFFPGMYSEGFIPLSTAFKLIKEVNVDFWQPGCILLGTSNRILRLGSSLIEMGVSKVICLESYLKWGAKRYAGWEVEKRRFESLGGKIIEGKPKSLEAKSPMRWSFQWEEQNASGEMEVGRVISGGPFFEPVSFKENPTGSLLFEFEQIALSERNLDFDAWTLEQERGKQLALKIIKALVPDLGLKRDHFNQLSLRTKNRLKRYTKHYHDAFDPVYEGKWISPEDLECLKSFQGVPKRLFRSQPMASIECFEDISCTICQNVCPEKAIEKGRVLIESRCTACGICVNACPSQSISMIHEPPNKSSSNVYLPYEKSSFKEGDFVSVVNRRGQVLGASRILAMKKFEEGGIAQLDVPPHLIWDVRGIQRSQQQNDEGQLYLTDPEFFEGKVEIFFNHEKRFVKDDIPLSLALLATGRARNVDVLSCDDGSCKRCYLSVDGITKLACQTRVHRGMSVELASSQKSVEPSQIVTDELCPCLKIKKNDILDRLKGGNLKSVEAVLAITQVGQGQCHGAFCMGALKQLLREEGFDLSDWVDWRFPWVDWTFS